MDWNTSDFADDGDNGHRPRRSPSLLTIVLAGVFLLLGIGLGWLVFGRERGIESTETLLSPSTWSTIEVEAPTDSPVQTGIIPLPGFPTLAPTPTLSAPVMARVVTPLAGLTAPELHRLQAYALDLINQSRSSAGLRPVKWDEKAAQLAQTHAEDMLLGSYFSHWNRDGYGPDHRAALQSRMTDAVRENIHAFWRRASNGEPAPIEDWPQRVHDAHEGLMNSPGHRENILDPAHTHVGVGIAYRPEIGELRFVQEFVNRYVDFEPLPAEMSVGDEFTIAGRLLPGATEPLVNLAYEPFPEQMTVQQLDETSSYSSQAEFFSAPRIEIDGDRFQARAIFDYMGLPGIYHVRVFVTVGGEDVLATSAMVMVR